jgi:hypothetical protein
MCAACGAELEAGLRHFGVRGKAQDDTRAPGFFRGLPCHSLSGKADLVKKDGSLGHQRALGRDERLPRDKCREPSHRWVFFRRLGSADADVGTTFDLGSCIARQ